MRTFTISAIFFAVLAVALAGYSSSFSSSSSYGHMRRALQPYEVTNPNGDECICTPSVPIDVSTPEEPIITDQEPISSECNDEANRKGFTYEWRSGHSSRLG